MFFCLRLMGEGEWDMNRTLLSASATSHKGRSEVGEGAGSCCCEVSCFFFFFFPDAFISFLFCFYLFIFLL